MSQGPGVHLSITAARWAFQGLYVTYISKQDRWRGERPFLHSTPFFHLLKKQTARSLENEVEMPPLYHLCPQGGAKINTKRKSLVVALSHSVNNTCLPPVYDGQLFTPPSIGAVWNNYKHFWLTAWWDSTTHLSVIILYTVSGVEVSGVLLRFNEEFEFRSWDEFKNWNVQVQ